MERREFLKVACATGFLTYIDVPFASAQTQPASLEQEFMQPKGFGQLSVFWHWTGDVVTREGITSDLEGMAKSGVETAVWFVFAATGLVDGIESTEPDTEKWWGLFDHVMTEARRVNVKIVPHASVTWTPAGGPWITPELSQQAFVWSEGKAKGGVPFTGTLAKPPRPALSGGGGGGGAVRSDPIPQAFEDYHRDLGVIALRTPDDWGHTSETDDATVTASFGIEDAQKLRDSSETARVLDTDKEGWVQFAFDAPFLLRSVTVHSGVAARPAGGRGGPGARSAVGLTTAPPAGAGAPPPAGGGFGAGAAGGFNRPAQTLDVESSDDGQSFTPIGKLDAMTFGWQTQLPELTHTVKETRARYFRFRYMPKPQVSYDDDLPGDSYRGVQVPAGVPSPDAEPHPLPADRLALAHIVLSSTAVVHHLPGKNGSVWGTSRRVTAEEMPDHACIPAGNTIDLTSRFQPDGTVRDWTPGEGNWLVYRLGYTSQLKRSWTGFESDKFSGAAAELQYKSWISPMLTRLPAAKQQISGVMLDSWECGPQNWSPVLVAEFKKRRGYDPIPYLPIMAGVPIGSADVTEGFLLDARRTMAECLAENFYATLRRLSHADGLKLMSETVSPVLISDDMLHQKYTDIPGGEFWVRAMNNFKPADINDAVSAARVYGQNHIFTESFTGGAWQDHPYALKALGDHNFAQGINHIDLHVWNEQYYPTRAPGVPGAGTPFNQLNTWWKDGQAWRDYLKRCEVLLQEGTPVGDILYFTGENIPNRALIPPKYGTYFTMVPGPPEGVTANSINRDGVLHFATASAGSIHLKSGASYRILVLPPSAWLTPEVAEKVASFVAAGVTVLGPKPMASPSLEGGTGRNGHLQTAAAKVWGSRNVFSGQPLDAVMQQIGLEPDVIFLNPTNLVTGEAMQFNASEVLGVNPTLDGADRKGWGFEFIHRQGRGREIYFLSNQERAAVSVDVSFRIQGAAAAAWHADTGKVYEVGLLREEGGRTVLPMRFDPAGSCFVVFTKAAPVKEHAVSVQPQESAGYLDLRIGRSGLEGWSESGGKWQVKTSTGRTLNMQTPPPQRIDIDGAWEVTFPVKGGPKKVSLEAGSWTTQTDGRIKFYSGTAPEVHHPAAARGGGRDAVDSRSRRSRRPGASPPQRQGPGRRLEGALHLGHHRCGQGGRECDRASGDKHLGEPVDRRSGKPQSERVTTVVITRGPYGGNRAAADAPLLKAGLLGPVSVKAWMKAV